MIEASDRLRAALADRYRLESELGAGGSATVHLATDLKHQRSVAIKVLRTERGTAAGRDRFLREIETLGHLRHPHILPLLDSGALDELCYFVMPYCEGETLRDRIAREGQLPIDDAIRYAREVAEALGYAHAHGVIHRDVKPQNIMLESGHAVLADFGIALTADASLNGRLTQTGQSPGTPQYMSPEQAATDPHLDVRSDIYSLGCVLYEMLVGEPPFTGPTLRAILARHAIEPPPRIRVVRDTVPQSLEDVVFRALAKAPADRFPTAGAFARALEDVTRERVRRTGPTTGGTATIELAGAAAASGRRSLGMILLRSLAAVAFALLVLTAIGFLAIRAFDAKVGMPAWVSPSRSDYLTVGVRALIGPFVNGSLLVLLFLAIGYVPRLIHGVLVRTGIIGESRRRPWDRVIGGWNTFWDATRPQMVADCFFVAALMSAGTVLVASWPLLNAHFTTETAVFGCEARPFQRLTNVATAGLIFALAFGWHGTFRWLRRRHGSGASGGVARWGSAAIILLLVFVVTLPWRLMWAGGDERVLIDGERGYVLQETPSHVILHNAEQRTTMAYAVDDLPPLERLGVTGNVFEEPAAFHSGATDCTGLY